MSVALVWLVSPNIKVLNCFGVLDSSSFDFGNLPAKMGRKQKWNSRCLSSSTSSTEVKYSSTFGLQSETKFPILSSMVANPAGEIVLSSEQKVYDVVLKQATLIEKQLRISGDDVDVKPDIVLPGNNKSLLSEAYDRCREVCAGTLLMTPERRREIRAIDVWCRGTDELVDEPNASHITPQALGRWESRREDLFQVRPFDMLNVALQDTVTQFSLNIRLFKDMIEEMRMDLRKSAYKNFDKLCLYCYYTAGTVGLMSVSVKGIAPDLQATTESVYNAALALGIANQLTNILRDVGEDARRGRIYIPQDELAQAGLSDVFSNISDQLDYAARDRDPSRIREFYENIVVILNDVLSRL